MSLLFIEASIDGHDRFVASYRLITFHLLLCWWLINLHWSDHQFISCHEDVCSYFHIEFPLCFYFSVVLWGCNLLVITNPCRWNITICSLKYMVLISRPWVHQMWSLPSLPTSPYTSPVHYPAYWSHYYIWTSKSIYVCNFEVYMYE